MTQAAGITHTGKTQTHIAREGSRRVAENGAAKRSDSMWLWPDALSVRLLTVRAVQVERRRYSTGWTMIGVTPSGAFKPRSKLGKLTL